MLPRFTSCCKNLVANEQTSRFITPSFFDKYSSDSAPVIDEWSLCQKLGTNSCYNALKPHWESFVNEGDFWKIKDAGFNMVRIPIGYWAFMDAGEGYAAGAAEYLDRAIGWARKTGLKVMIDLHGAPRSQNGFDHSGHKTTPQWGQGDSVGLTHAVLEMITDKYAQPEMQDVVVGIQPLNEPWLVNGLDLNQVKQFYRDAYENLRRKTDTPFILHDGFVGFEWMNGFLTPADNGAYGIVVDHHEYQVFSPGELAMSPTDHAYVACSKTAQWATSDKWTIVGEWSGAMTDCALYLNGFKRPSTYEQITGSCWGKSGPVQYWTQDYKNDVRRYIEAQLNAFEQRTNGWVFWNFKTEGSAGEWDLFQLLDGGVFPQPLEDRRFGNICG